ncbi:MAG: tetratricopeptide repeat protein [Bryobacteraceae bacterium]|jgi:tetratricopeptide (TPR) repeat protein
MRLAACVCLCAFVLSAAEPAKEVFDRAVRDLAAGEYDAAERGFQSVLRGQPRHIAALSNLGVIYSRTNRADRAITVYRRALRVSPDDKAILLNLGLVYLKRDDHARALPLFARVVAIDPQHLQARQLLAVCRVYTGQLEPAIRELETLRATAPRDENVLFLLGFAYLKNHDAGRAKAIFELMFEAAGPARAQFLMGKANYEATLFLQAEEAFHEALRLAPKFPGVHFELGKVYISLRQNDDAIRELELALKENPGDADANYFLGARMVQDSRYAEGIPYLERARKMKPDFWASYFYLGKARLRLEQPADAVVLLQRAVELNPDEASAYYQLGRALEACGRKSEAGSALRRVRELRAAALQAITLDDGGVAGAR